MSIITDIRDRITATADHLSATGCDWTHEPPGGNSVDGDVCDCSGLTDDSCENGREGADAMEGVADTLRDAAKALDEGDLPRARKLVERASDLESEWGDDPACAPLREALAPTPPEDAGYETVTDRERLHDWRRVGRGEAGAIVADAGQAGVLLDADGLTEYLQEWILDDEIHPEHLPHTVERDGEIPLEFSGRVLGEGRQEAGRGWTWVVVYRTEAGALVTAVEQGLDDGRHRARAAIHDTATEAIDWLREDAGGSLGRASRDALSDARDRDEDFAAAAVERIA